MNYLNLLLFFMPLFFDTTAQPRTASLPAIQWSIAGSLPASATQSVALGFAGPVAGIINDVLLVAGGANFPGGMPWEGGKKKYYDDVYLYHWQKDTLIMKQGVYKLPVPVAYAASCTTPRGILYAGGENENGITNQAFLLQWNAALHTISTINLPPLPAALTNAA